MICACFVPSAASPNNASAVCAVCHDLLQPAPEVLKCNNVKCRQCSVSCLSEPLVACCSELLASQRVH